MKKTSTGILTLVMLLSVMVGCKKYEDGPTISFRSKTQRVINTWKAKYVFMDEVDATAAFNNWVLDLTEDGRMTSTDSVLDTIAVQEGFWELVNDKEEIRFIYTDPPVNPDRKFCEILRLKEDELWFREVTDTITWEFRLEPAGGGDGE